MVEKTMPRRIAAFHFLAIMMIVTMRPKTVTAMGTPTRSGIVSGVPEPLTTMPPSTRPMNRMKKPMPTTIAFLSSMRDRLEDRLAKPGEDEDRDDDAFHDDDAHRGGEAEALGQATSEKATTALRPMPGAIA